MPIFFSFYWWGESGCPEQLIFACTGSHRSSANTERRQADLHGPAGRVPAVVLRIPNPSNYWRYSKKPFKLPRTFELIFPLLFFPLFHNSSFIIYHSPFNSWSNGAIAAVVDSTGLSFEVAVGAGDDFPDHIAVGVVAVVGDFFHPTAVGSDPGADTFSTGGPAALSHDNTATREKTNGDQ